MTAESVWVWGDATRIEQIIANLLGNALKYTPAGGELRVSVRGGDEAVLEVADNGIGIAADVLPRIFDLFAQGQRSLDRSQGGLGLGLTLVRRLVQLHGGSVTATSAGIDRGATFTVTLPRIEAPVEAGGPPPSRSHAMSRLRVLIVDDNPDGREALHGLLELEGHEIHEAADGVAGLEASLALKPDVAMIDIGLPGLDGYEVARHLRQTGFTGRLVALTGYGHPDDWQRAREAGFDGYLVKPVKPDELISALVPEADRTSE